MTCNVIFVKQENSTAKYIIQQYLAATGCMKQKKKEMKNMYATGTVKMVCCETGCTSMKIFEDLKHLSFDVLIMDGLGRDHKELLANTLAVSLRGHRVIISSSSQNGD